MSARGERGGVRYTERGGVRYTERGGARYTGSAEWSQERPPGYQKRVECKAWKRTDVS